MRYGRLAVPKPRLLVSGFSVRCMSAATASIRSKSCALANRQVDASTYEQDGARQRLAGIHVANKNRCIRISAGNARAALLPPVLRAGRDNFRDNLGDRRVPVT